MISIVALTGILTAGQRREIERDSRGIIQYAADHFQRGLLKGLSKTTSGVVSAVNLPFVGSYPQSYANPWLRGINDVIPDHVRVDGRSFLNIRFFRIPFQFFAALVGLFKHGRKPDILLVYSPHNPFIAAALFYTLLHKRTKICLVLPDLPEFIGEGSRWRRLTVLVSNSLFRSMIKHVDYFVLLTEAMAERLELSKPRYIVMEGIYDEARAVNDKSWPEVNERIFAYTGSLMKRYGILDLLDAFRSLDAPAARLWICGEGDARLEVEEAAKQDSRIRFFGQVSPNHVTRIHQSAHILVNPRTPDDEFTKYSFPSKTIEYMASGKPVLMHRLPGVPNEYFPFLITPELPNRDGLLQSLRFLTRADSEYLRCIGLRGQQFVLKTKSPEAQCQRIVDFITADVPTIPAQETTTHRKLAISILSGLASQGVLFLAPILVLPLLLSSMGEVAFGIWATTLSVCGILAFLDLGLSSTLLTGLSRAFSKQDMGAARRYLATAYTVLGLVSSIGLVTCGTVIWLELVSADWSARPIIAAILIPFFIGLPATIVYRVLYARQRILLSNSLQAVSAIFAVAACYIAVALEAKPWVLVGIYSAIPVVVMVLSTIWFFSKYSFLIPRITDLRITGTAKILGMSSQFFVLAILTSVSQNSDILIISLLTGPELSANYVPPQRIGFALAQVVAQLFMPLWSFHAAALARNDAAWVARTSRLMSWGGSVAVLTLGAMITLASTPIMLAWMGREFTDQTVILAGMTLVSAIIAFTSPYNMALNAQGEASVQVKAWAIFLVFSITLKVIAAAYNYVWVIPIITCVCYAAIITPSILRATRTTLSRKQFK